ncbi:MAG: phosphonate C-P lyase system protein PhnG [Rhodospirillales bacterium]|nr:phosphonate C-P lyase system protein PhnG [Rhodospirillales bacterium]
MVADPASPPADPAHHARAAWIGLLARAAPAELAACLDTAPPLPDFALLRGPQTGLVMLRGRAGGGGAPFNLGEMTVTRASVRDAAGRIGHATVRGRDAAHALAAARLDAALQDPGRHAALRTAVLDPLAASEAQRRSTLARRAAATRVDFFTLATQR